MLPLQVRLVFPALRISSVFLSTLQRAVAKKGADHELSKILIGRLALVSVTPRLRPSRACFTPKTSHRRNNQRSAWKPNPIIR